jgi:hypothetical protein
VPFVTNCKPNRGTDNGREQHEDYDDDNGHPRLTRARSLNAFGGHRAFALVIMALGEGGSGDEVDFVGLL